MIKGIIFDFDGVIVDSEYLHYQAFLEIFKRWNVSFEYDIYVNRYIGFDDRDGFAAIGRDFGVSLNEELIAELIAEKAEVFENLHLEGSNACAGAVVLIEAANEAYPIAISSGATRRDIMSILPALGQGDLVEKFGAIVTADDVRRSKPDPESYLQAAEKIGIDAGLCLAIEDTTTGLASARGAGMRTLAVAGTYSEKELAGHAERVVSSLEDVTIELIREWYAKPMIND